MSKEKGDNLSSSAIKTAAGNFGSRMSGFLRDVLFANFFGTSGAMSAFLTALTFPNLSRRIFGEGALTASFIPLLSDKLKNEKDAWSFTSTILSITTVLTSVIALLGIIGCSVTAILITGDKQIIFKLTAWLLPYMVFICLSALISGTLNLLKSFSLPALSSTFLNIFLILTCLATSLTDISIEKKILFLAFAVIFSGIFQCAVLYRALVKKGAKLKWQPNFKSDHWTDVKKLFIPAILGSSVAQLSVLSDRIIANWLGDHAVSALYYSERLTYFPVGIFGVALGVACLPYMSRAVSNDNQRQLMDAFSFGLRQVAFLTIPCSALFLLYNSEILTIAFKRGEFDAKSLSESTLAFIYYLPGIPAFAAIKVVLPLYFARKDTRTPVNVAIFCLILNLIIGLSFIPILQHGSLALATTISSYTNITLLLILSKNKQVGITILNAILPIIRILIATTLACWATSSLNWSVAESSSLSNLFLLLCKCGCCASAFIFIHTITGGQELKELLSRNTLN